MTRRIKTVMAQDDYIIEAVFFDGQKVLYDVKPLFVIFPEFRIFESDLGLYNAVTVDPGGYGVSWNEELDLDAETIWQGGVLIEKDKAPDINHLLAYKLLLARKTVQMTQKELAEGMGMELRIDFVK